MHIENRRGSLFQRAGSAVVAQASTRATGAGRVFGVNWRPDRTAIGRRSDEPGDGFVYLVSMTPRVEDRFEWLEVTEVFTTVPASQIEGAMRAWNGISDKHPVDFDEFRRGLPRGRPLTAR